MANFLKKKIAVDTVRSFSSKTKLKIFPMQPNLSQFDNLAEEAPREEPEQPREEATPIYDYSNSVRYKVCQDQERVPVHKIFHTTPLSYQQVKASIVMQSLQPALLPEFYKSNN